MGRRSDNSKLIVLPALGNLLYCEKLEMDGGRFRNHILQSYYLGYFSCIIAYLGDPRT
jgi:hypothetical protein